MRNPRALYKADRIDPHPKKPSARPHKRRRAQEPPPEESEAAPDVPVGSHEVDIEDARVDSMEQDMSADDGHSDGGESDEVDGEDSDGDGDGDGEEEVFSVARSVHEAEDKPKRTGSVLRTAKVPLYSHVLMRF